MNRTTTRISTIKDGKVQGKRKRVIVLGGQYAALGVAKALAKERIEVILLAPNPHDHASHSRFVSRQILVPHLKDDSKELLDLLMNMDKDWNGTLLLPTLDEYVLFISQYRSELQKKYVFAVPDSETIQKIISKDLLYLNAQKVGVPTPRFFLPNSIEFLNENRKNFSYPLILKPKESYKFRLFYDKKVLIVNDFQELCERFTDTYQKHLDVMISEIIPGDDSAIYNYHSYIDSQGNIAAEMCSQKVRQYPKAFGQGSIIKTIPIIPEIRDLTLNLLRSLSYRGPSDTEFKLDYRDNQYKLMDINTRPIVQEWLFSKAGINFSYITYLDLVENIRSSSPAYRQDVYWINNLWETINFLDSLGSGKLNLRKFLEPYWKEKVFAVPFSDDPVHFFIEMYFNGMKILKRASNSSDLSPAQHS